MPKGALIGVMPGLRYTANEVELDQGVALVCYTDGVTEAESAAGHAFSDERLLRVGAANCDQSVEDLLSSVQRELATFLDGMPLADDCTLVAVRRPVRSGLR
jgi:sigma-B regulation protein RsbU (phosphoserine phosphatase)